MIPAVRLTPETLADFERHLSARGCYTPATVRNKVSLARALQSSTFSATGFPLDEDAAIDRIRDTQSPGRRRRTLNTTARDLIAFLRTRHATEVAA
ncbi:MAG: hypothetical protein GX625_21780 [Clostridiaceae bacterium]|jgi:hypothetical protein|nr:hypothetical protein [Clostridiaceae bacterium]